MLRFRSTRLQPKLAGTSPFASLVMVAERDPARLHQLAAAVLPILATRHRASSAVENLNSVLRPDLFVRKHAEQDLL
jgi:hypothetical protein